MSRREPSPIVSVSRKLFGRHGETSGARSIPEETPIALTYQQSTYAVMMGSPANLEEFAVGFSITERIISSPDEIISLEVARLPNGIELRMTLAADRDEALQARKRRFAGPAGCGLCGIESLEAATIRPPAVRSDLHVGAHTIFEALQQLRAHQTLNAQTLAVHAAGFWSLERRGYVAVREDVGRHNALDKLVGALVGKGTADRGFIVLTSRLSVELVQKAAVFGCPLLVAISAPTALAVREADAAQMTLAGVARNDSFEVFTHPKRIAAS